MTDEQVERVARAIHAARQLAGYSGQAAWEYEPADIQALYRLTARAAIAAMGQEPEMGWQPIETAPKDGTRVLLMLRGPKPPETIARWSQDWTAEEEDDAFEWVNDEDDAIYGTPTHWRPLPAPPADPRVKEGG